MERLEAYCDRGYLDSLYKKIREYFLSLSPDTNKGWLTQLFQLIHNNCILITDIPADEIIRRSKDTEAADYNPYFKKLWKNGSINVVSYPETFHQMIYDSEYFKGKTNELYLLSTEKYFCNSVSNKYGLLCTSADEMEIIIPRLFVFEIKAINKGSKIRDWSFLNQFRYPSNSAVIADNFMLKYDDSVQQRNILEILRNIMPLQLEDSFDLTIFSREVRDIEKEYKFLKSNFLDKLPYPVNLSIGIVSIGSLERHARDIITNYCWYCSDGGFTLFIPRNNSIGILHDSKVFIYPITYIGDYSKAPDKNNDELTPIQESYFSVLDAYKKVWRELPETLGNMKTFIGERKNRLLD